jgi:hypothetical protein
MIMNMFECKVSYEKTQDTGAVKTVTESYLVDAVSCTEADARISEHLKPYISGEFTVDSIKRSRFRELFFNLDGDRFYKVKVFFVTLDERSGAEKKTVLQMLAQASDVRDALDVVDEGMKGTLADYGIVAVSETVILEVIQHENA